VFTRIDGKAPILALIGMRGAIGLARLSVMRRRPPVKKISPIHSKLTADESMAPASLLARHSALARGAAAGLQLQADSMKIARDDGMNAPKQESPQQFGRFAAVVGLAIVVAAGIKALIPNARSITSITAADKDDHPILSVPTVGRIVRFHKDAPRRLTEWGGRVDLARFAPWRETVPQQADSAAGFGIDGPVPKAQPWPHELLEDLPGELRAVPFIQSGEKVWEWNIVRDATRYRLRVGMSSGHFVLLRTAVEDEA
jgi:hypothetical protein